MAEWHITPDYIVNNWTDELLNLMVEKLTARKQGLGDADSAQVKTDGSGLDNMGSMVKVIRKDGD